MAIYATSTVSPAQKWLSVSLQKTWLPCSDAAPRLKLGPSHDIWHFRQESQPQKHVLCCRAKISEKHEKGKLPALNQFNIKILSDMILNFQPGSSPWVSQHENCSRVVLKVYNWGVVNYFFVFFVYGTVIFWKNKKTKKTLKTKKTKKLKKEEKGGLHA